jgi:hypothetical protein
MTEQLHQINPNFLPRLALEFQKRDRYLLLGEISLALGYSLEIVESKLNSLISFGYIRHLTPIELKSFGLHKTTAAYIPVEHEFFKKIIKEYHYTA